MMPRSRFLLRCMAFLCAWSLGQAHAQTDEEPLPVASVLQLLPSDSSRYDRPLSTSLADQYLLDLREAAGIIMVITAEEIASSGARDLEEALQLLASIQVARDVDDVVSVMIRGNWASEGKCLIMLNGTPLNEIAYGTYALGARIPLGNVSRIEVITGPGSVMHGGFTALGVVNIVTKDSREFMGAEVQAHASVAHDRLSRTSVQAHGSHRLRQDLEVQYALNAGTGVRSAGSTVLADGEVLDFGDSTSYRTNAFMLGLRGKRTRAQLYHQQRTCAISDAAYDLEQRDLLADIEHVLDVARNTTLTLGAHYRDQLPWNWVNHPDGVVYGSHARRLGQTLLLRWRIRGRFSVVAGAGGGIASARLLNHGATFRRSSEPTLVAYDYSAFVEGCWSGSAGHFSAGLRSERNSFSPKVVAPRLAWTKAGRHWHGKLLHSLAYRLPTYENDDAAVAPGTLRNELVSTTEAELGWRSRKGLECAVSAYRVSISDPIMYSYADGQEHYANADQAGTAGLEARLRHASRKLMLHAVYAHYWVPRADGGMPEAELPQPWHRAYAGAARSKFLGTFSWRFATRLHVEGRAMLLSRIWSLESGEGANPVLQQHMGGPVLDGGLRFVPQGRSGWSVRLGLRDILKQARPIPSPYNNGLVPIPPNGRELTLSLICTLGT